MDEKGILTVEQEKQLSVIIDDALPLKGWAEFIDGYAARVLVSVVDNQVVDKLKADLKAQLSELATLLLDEEWDEAEDKAADILNLYVDIPVLEEDAEGLIFLGAVQMIIGAVQKWIAKKKEE